MWKKIKSFYIEHVHSQLIKILLFITKGEILYITLAAVIAIFIVCWEAVKHRDITNVIDFSTFSAVVLEGFLVALVSLLRAKILNHTEDPQKLTDNYQDLIKRYSSEPDMLWTRNRGKELTILPVIHVAWLSSRELKIFDHPEQEFLLPEIVDKYFEELFRTHQTSKIYNNTNIRVDDWYIDESQNSFKLFTSRTSYYNSLVTNRAMDYKLENGISVRELLEYGPTVHPLKHSKLSNHLGFNGFVESSDCRILFVKRKNDVSIGKRTWGDSVGASLKSKYALDQAFVFTKEGLLDGIIHEIEDELGIPAVTLVTPETASNNLGLITIIAAYRDMLEGGKPQLLFYAKTSMSRSEISESFRKTSAEITRTQSDCNRVQNGTEMQMDGKDICWIRTEEIKSCDVYSNKIVHEGNPLKMLPSAAACVAMFSAYLSANGHPSVRYGMPVAECFLHGKRGSADLCEDALFMGKRFVAVIDGVTSKSNNLFDGKTPGKLASELLVKAFSQLDHARQSDTDKPISVLMFLDTYLKLATARYAGLEPEDYPRASVVYYDRLYKIVVSYGDCQCRIGNAIYDHHKQIDTVLSEKRSSVLCKLIEEEHLSVNQLLCNDPGRAAILEDLQKQHSHENISIKDDRYGYPVLNGCGICSELIKCYPTNEGEFVILCSDGYPKVCDTLKESEDALSSLLKEDPLLIGQNRMKYKSTKGLQSGAESFDDRSWIKLG